MIELISMDSVSNFFSQFLNITTDFFILVLVILYVVLFFVVQYFLIKMYIFIVKYIIERFPIVKDFVIAKTGKFDNEKTYNK